ncbi:hypothetical protein LCGC14_2924670 [marine sediment metagenome]|uniref:Uncharacterized protein n=1 Tax=marine sediment metagenome TaxID=412755 RepID=A0A0F8ZVE9_9ZZZZ
MPHLAGKCNCGKAIHYPKNAIHGDTWKCYKCGTVWTLAEKGEPLHTVGSRPPVTNSETPQESDSGSCFIATAVYYSYDAPEVLVLRRFRDDVLLKNKVGRIFVLLYYKISPYYAKRIKATGLFRNMTKHVLCIIVKYIRNRNKNN